MLKQNNFYFLLLLLCCVGCTSSSEEYLADAAQEQQHAPARYTTQDQAQAIERELQASLPLDLKAPAEGPKHSQLITLSLGTDSMTFRSTANSADELVFENLNTGFPSKVVYQFIDSAHYDRITYGIIEGHEVINTSHFETTN